MAAPAIDPFANGENPFRATIDPFGRLRERAGNRRSTCCRAPLTVRAHIETQSRRRERPRPPRDLPGRRRSTYCKLVSMANCRRFGVSTPSLIFRRFPSPAGLRLNGVNGAVSFTDPNNANPFSDLPPVPLTPSMGAVTGKSDLGQQTLDSNPFGSQCAAGKPEAGRRSLSGRSPRLRPPTAASRHWT